METQRLYIRRFNENDWRDLHEYLSDERVVKYEPYQAMSESECKVVAKKYAESEDFWAAVLKENNKLIGNVYLALKDHNNYEVGYVFNFAYQGKGYGSEAVKALANYAFCEKKAHRIFAECNPENTRSWALLERIGFKREGRLRKNIYFSCDEDGKPIWQDTFIYGALEEEWKLTRKITIF